MADIFYLVDDLGFQSVPKLERSHEGYSQASPPEEKPLFLSSMGAFSKLTPEWESGNPIVTERPICGYYDIDPDIGEGLGGTALATGKLQIILSSLKAIIADIPEMNVSADEAQKDIESCPYLNIRQRHVVAAMAEGEMVATKIKAHRDLYRIAYAAARDDLLGLADLGRSASYTREMRWCSEKSFDFAPTLAVLCVKERPGGWSGSTAESNGAWRGASSYSLLLLILRRFITSWAL